MQFSVVLLILFFSATSWAQSGVNGEVFQFTNSELGTSEKCIAVHHIPSGDYSKKDIKKENSYCSIDLYSEDYAVCPKTWSTSPATMIYKLGDSGISADDYESSNFCGNPNKKRPAGVKTKAKLKTTMHQSDTSGTYSKSSLMYYHLSRYFDMEVTVPVSVYREFNARVYDNRGTAQLGLQRGASKMNRAGWRWIMKALDGNYSPDYDIFSDESKENLYGVLIKGPGERYGPEFNGVRGGGYVSQHQKFQRTPGFLALKSSKPLLEATMTGVAQASQDSKMRPYMKDLEGQQGQQQLLFWMRELIEINLLDFIFSQQDRVGNIDYRFYWYYVKDGDVQRQKVEADYDNRKRDFINRLSHEGVLDDEGMPISQYNPVIVQRTFLNDNDAGTKTSYANFAKKVGHLKGMKHYSLKIYRKLHELNRDLQAKGEVYQWAAHSVGLTPGELKWFRENTQLATENLTAQCESGMSFDLDNVDEFLVSGVQRAESVDCQNP